MKKALCFLLTLCILASFFCLGAAAAEIDAASGIYALTKASGFTDTVTLTPKTATGGTVSATSATVDNEPVDFYADAAKVEVTFSDVQANAQYLVLALNDNSTTPTQGNITYIDQTGGTSTGVTFTVYPASLESGKTYSIYLTSSASEGSVQGLTKIASFKYFAPYVLGDANEDGEIDTFDAMRAINHYVKNITLTGNALLAADVTKDGEVDTFDAMRIINYYVHNITEF